MNRIVEFAASFLLNAAWQIAAVAIAASLCSLFLRRVAARYHHALWVGALVLSVAVPLWGVFGLTGNVAPEVGAPLPVSAMRVPDSLLATDSVPASTVAKSPERSRVSLGRLMQRNSQSVTIASPLLLLLTIGYAFFLLYRLNRLWRAWRQARSLDRSAYEPEILAPLATLTDGCQATFNLQRVRLKYSPRATMPVTLGTREPVIILPENFNAERSEETLLSVIGHEMAHIARRDWPLNLAYEFLWLPISFHPLANLIKRQIDRTRELACDDMVAARLVERGVYARSLMRVASTLVSHTGQVLTLGVFDADILEERIMKLTQKRRQLGLRVARAIFVTAFTGLCLSALAISTFSFDLRTHTSALGVKSVSIQPAATLSIALAVATEPTQGPNATQTRSRSDKLLNSASPQERAQVACDAGRNHAVEAIPILVSMLGDDTKTEPLKCWDSGRWNPALETFKQPSPGEQAAIALASMGKPAFEPLTNELANANSSVRRNAAWAIGELTNMSTEKRSGAVPQLVSLLSDSDEWVRMAAARALGELRDDRAGESLIAALADGHDRLREIAAWALSELKYDRAVQPLCRLLLADANPEVRWTAAMALGEIRSAQAVASLKQALSDPEPRVRTKVKWALAEIEDAGG